MTSKNSFKLIRFNGTEEYSFKNGTIEFYEKDNKKYLGFRIKTDKCLSFLLDTKEQKQLPKYSVEIEVEDYGKLVSGAEFELENSYNDKTEKYYSNLYYFEHQEVNKNKIRILDAKEGGYLVRITGETIDINHYDGSKPFAKIEIIGYFEKLNK